MSSFQKLTGSWEARLDLVMPEDEIRGRVSPIKSLTEEWFRARRGRCTASKRAETIAVGRAAGWKTMLTDVNYELSPRYSRDGFSNEAMQWGNDHENEALANAELELDADIFEPGFLLHPKYSYAGATPDFFLGSDTTGQIKCPYNSDNHTKYIYGAELNSTYHHQVQWEAWCSQRPKIIFISYDPRQPIVTRTHVMRLGANPALWDKFDQRLAEFKKLVDGGASPAAVKLVETIGIPELF